MANFSIIDTHTHNYFSAWEDTDALFQRSADAGVIAQVQIGADEQASFSAIELAKKYPNCYATVGIHPTDVKFIGNPDSEFRSKTCSYTPVAQNIEELFAIFDQWILENKNQVVGIGECGFDFYHDSRETAFSLQEDAFLRHIELAQKHDLPLVIHTREAKEEVIEFFKQHIVGKGIRGVVHCFSEDLEAARFFTEEAGFFLGIGGIVTYKKSDILRDVVKHIPLEMLVTETDSPFLPPQEFRKKNSTNESAALVEVVEKIAEVRGEAVSAVADQLVENAKQLFRIKC
jgi:TatD DNase family protein